MKGIETIYRHHHTKDDNHKRNFAILKKERGSFLRRNIGTGKKVLDIGCRDGELTSTYCRGNSILGLDIDREALEIAKKKTGIDIRHIDLNSDWGISKNTFDVVVACEVLEHLYYPDIVLNKIKEVLKGGGILVGSIPHAFNLQTRIKFLFGIKASTALNDPTHINHFGYREFRDLLRRNFKNIHIEGITTRRYRWLHSLFPFLFSHTLLFYAEKK